MRVAIEHVFEGISAAAYETLFFDEAFNESLGRHLHMGRMLVRLDRDADRIVRHVRFEPAQDPDSPARQAFGSSRASFLEELDYEPRSRRGNWRTVPNLMSERVKNTGTLEFLDVPEGTKRIVTGEIVVKLFGFGGRVEKMIAAEIVKSYEQTTAFTRAWLAKR
jgi:hypothetical protein